jgi:glycine cleavage system regulatory protein
MFRQRQGLPTHGRRRYKYNMNVSLVMTIVGVDRPGLVERLSSVIVEHGGNWLESRMAHLGGQFAGILRVSVPAVNEHRLLAALQAMQELSVYAHADVPSSAAATGILATVEVVGHDRPGIIRQISLALAQRGVNVEELTSACESAPMSAEILFRATATVRLPESLTLRQLQQSLEQIATDLMVDVREA